MGKKIFDVVPPMFEEILMTFDVILPFLVPKKGGNGVVSSLYYKDTTF